MDVGFWLWLKGVLSRLFKREGAAVAVEGFEKLSGRQNDWIDRVEHRLKDCEDDREQLNVRLEACEADRILLRRAIVSLQERVQDLEDRSNTI